MTGWLASGVDVAGKEWAYVGDREAAEAQAQTWREAGWPQVRNVVPPIREWGKAGFEPFTDVEQAEVDTIEWRPGETAVLSTGRQVFMF